MIASARYQRALAPLAVACPASETDRTARSTKNSPIPATTARASVRVVSTNSGMTAGQAAEPGLTDSTPTMAQSGRENSHIAAGSTMRHRARRAARTAR